MEPILCDKLYRCGKTQTITFMVIFALTGPTAAVLIGLESSIIAGVVAALVAIGLMGLVVVALVNATAKTPRLTYDSTGNAVFRETGWLFVEHEAIPIDMSSCRELTLDVLTGTECSKVGSPTIDKVLYVLSAVHQSGVSEVLVRSNYASELDQAAEAIAAAYPISIVRSERYIHVAKLNAFRER